MAKKDKCGACTWEKTGKKKHPWECSVCGDVFPCKKKDCGHLDCHLESARSCHICSKRIPNTSSTYYFLDGRGIDLYSVHKGCVGDDYAYSIKIHEL